jgi:hypothetical protein
MKIMIATPNDNSTYIRIYFYDTITKTVDYLRIGFFGGSNPTCQRWQFYNQFPEFAISQNDAFFNHPSFPTTLYYNYRADDFVLEEFCLAGTTTLRTVTTTGLTSVDYPSISNIANVDTTSTVCGYKPKDINITNVTQSESGGTVTVTIFATSSYSPIEYSLNGIDYQVSNVFDLTVAGSYTAYARDAEGYVDTEVFLITLSSYGLKYLGEFTDNKGQDFEIKIYEKDFAGSYSTLQLAGEPLVIKHGKDTKRGDKYNSICGSQATVSFQSSSAFQYLNLFTAEDKKYRLDVIKEGDIYWTGFIATEAYSEPYTDTPYPVKATFLDGLGVLKRREFKDPGQNIINKIKSHLETIRVCLNETGLQLPLHTAISIYETRMADQTTDGDPLAQAYLNTAIYLDQNGNAKDCYTVLESILAIYGARIYQEDAAWKIIDVDNQRGSYFMRVYSSGGIQGTTIEVDPEINTTAADSPDMLRFLNGATLEINPAYESIDAKIEIKPLSTVLSNGNFKEEGDGDVFKDWTDNFNILSKGIGYDAGGNQINIAKINGDGSSNSWGNYIAAKLINIPVVGNTVKLQVKARFTPRTSVPVTQIQVKFMVKLDANYLTIAGAWVTSESYLTYDATENFVNELNLESALIPQSGVLEFRIYQTKVIDPGVDADSLDVELVEVKVTESGVAIPEDQIIKVDNEGEYVFKADTKNLLFADFPGFNSVSTAIRNVIFLDSAGTIVSKSWNRYGFTESIPLIRLLLERIMHNNETPSQSVSGTIYGEIKYGNTLSDINNPGKKFIVTNKEEYSKKCQHKIQIDEISNTAVSNTYLLNEADEILMTEGGEYLTTEG